jgi:hypothetical protein
MKAGDPIDFAGSLPAKDVLPTPEDLEKEFISNTRANFKELVPDEHPLYPSEEEFEKMLQLIDFAKNDKLFKALPKGDTEQVIRGVSPGVGPRKVARILKAVYDDRDNPPKKYPRGSLDFLSKRVFGAAYLAILDKYKASEMAKLRKQTLAETEYVTDMKELVAFYNGLTEEEKKLALKNSLGYLDTFQFSLNRSQSTNPNPPISTENLGVISIGGAYVEKMLTQISQVLDKEIFAVFTSLKELSDSLNGFFAGGLADDKKASTAIQSAQDIEKKTTELKSDK